MAELARLHVLQQLSVFLEHVRGVIGGSGLGDDLTHGDRGVQPTRAERRPRDDVIGKQLARVIPSHGGPDVRRPRAPVGLEQLRGGPGTTYL
jgi:hypothetical protein